MLKRGIGVAPTRIGSAWIEQNPDGWGFRQLVSTGLDQSSQLVQPPRGLGYRPSYLQWEKHVWSLHLWAMIPVIHLLNNIKIHYSQFFELVRYILEKENI